MFESKIWLVKLYCPASIIKNAIGVRAECVCMCAAALQHQDEPRAVVMAKMVEQAKQLESRAADTIQAVLDHELGQSANGGSFCSSCWNLHDSGSSTDNHSVVMIALTYTVRHSVTHGSCQLAHGVLPPLLYQVYASASS